MTRPAQTRSRDAFTLLELMVALGAGVMTITVVYTLSAGTSRILGDQHRVSQTQTAVRLAMEQVRADVERAGLFGTPNAYGEQHCDDPGSTFQAVYFEDSYYTDQIPNADMHGVQADRLILTGNYVTTGSYILAGISVDDPEGSMADGSQLALQDTWQSFRRDVGTPLTDGGATNDTYQAQFARVFADDRWMHVTTLQGQHFFTKVTGRQIISGRPPQILINPSMAPGGLCTVGLAHGSTIAPINSIEYAIVNPRLETTGELAALVGLRGGESETTRDYIEGIPSVLIRREVDPITRAPIPGTTRVVLEYAVEFDLEFDVDSTTGPDSPPTIVRATPEEAEGLLGPAGTSPQQVRAAEIHLSARTPDAERTYPFVPRAAGAPLTRYYAREIAGSAANASRMPSSRVRSLVTDAFIPNVAYRDLPASLP